MPFYDQIGFVVLCFLLILVATIATAIPVVSDDDSDQPMGGPHLVALTVAVVGSAWAIVLARTPVTIVHSTCALWVGSSLMGAFNRKMRPKFSFWDVAVPLLGIVGFYFLAHLIVTRGMLSSAAPLLVAAFVALTIVSSIVTLKERMEPWNFTASAGSTAAAAILVVLIFEVARKYGWFSIPQETIAPLLIWAIASGALFAALAVSRAIGRLGSEPNSLWDDSVEFARTFVIVVMAVLMILVSAIATYTHYA